MTTELYTLLKVKGEYIHTRKDGWIYRKLKEPDVREYNKMLHDCRDRNLIESRGERNLNCSLYYRDLFLTPYGEKRLNQLEAEYMKGYRTKYLSSAKTVLEVIAAVVGILAFLLKYRK